MIGVGDAHGPELDEAEDLLITPDAVLAEQDGAAQPQADDESDHRDDRRENEEGEAADGDVDAPGYPLVVSEHDIA
ncbi:hypothetical protein GCM10009810_28920 [Nostocoides vanveenii]|uniref:Uncharacterized protein n=1 Tax=Nostocoides vanveenii TaxID=330835 RepID=A0ABN2KX87_9MICO